MPHAHWEADGRGSLPLHHLVSDSANPHYLSDTQHSIPGTGPEAGKGETASGVRADPLSPAGREEEGPDLMDLVGRVYNTSVNKLPTSQFTSSLRTPANSPVNSPRVFPPTPTPLAQRSVPHIQRRQTPSPLDRLHSAGAFSRQLSCTGGTGQGPGDPCEGAVVPGTECISCLAQTKMGWRSLLTSQYSRHPLGRGRSSATMIPKMAVGSL